VLLYITLPVSAATTDDLRELIGGSRVTEEAYIKEMKQIIYYYNSMERKEQLFELMKGLGNEKEISDYEDLLKKTSLSVDKLVKDFKAAKSPAVLLEDYNDIYSMLKKIDAVSVADTISPAIYTTNVKDIEDLYQYALSVKKSIDDNTEIGILGEELLPPSGKDFQLVQSFGENKIILSNPTIETSNGITMSVRMNSQVYSQFNGVVESVLKTEDGYKVVITTGKSIECIYSNIGNIRVKNGSKVKQYDVLGTAGNNKLIFSVKLNTVFINPLYLYGTKGITAYEKWMAANPEMVVTRTDFSYVLKDIVKESESQQTSASIVNDEGETSEIIWEDGYEAPEIPDN
jgi:murein DD-endopeptidase MepM/ murein hydrolase activator NlpD